MRGQAIYGHFKRAFLGVSKWLGLFRLARYLTRGGLRILCYHGFTLADERWFHPELFIEPSTFERRLRFLSTKHFPVLQLNEALDLLEQDRLPAGATAITIDDGFHSVYQSAVGLLKKYSLPATVYVTSYYSIKEKPVFRLVVQYMFWRTAQPQLDLSDSGIGLTGRVSLREKEQKDRVMWEIIRHGEEHCDEAGRNSLAETLGKHLDVDYSSIVQGEFLSLLSCSEIRRLANFGMDIQLHGHRHRFPEDQILATREIADNKAVLEPLVGKPLQHFCYPSGLWSEKQWPWLTAAGIRSATTCEPGLNYPGTPRLALKRFLDSESISQIEFEAEMCGYGELLRRSRAWVKHVIGANRRADIGQTSGIAGR